MNKLCHQNTKLPQRLWLDGVLVFFGGKKMKNLKQLA